VSGLAPLDGLAPAERLRLDGFATLFDRLDASQYATLTETSPNEAVESAKERAGVLVGRGGRRRDAVRAAIKAFTDAATTAYAGRMSLTDTLLLFQSLPDRAEDRTRFLQSVERTVVALILWDELDDEDRAALVGPWADLLAPLVEAYD
jgi:hypothetical protein